MSITITVDEDNCAGCGYCTTQVPEVLELKDTATVKAQYQGVVISDPALVARLKTVADECPCGAISIQDASQPATDTTCNCKHCSCGKTG